MTHKTIGRAALVSLALGSATIGCTPSARIDHVAALSDAGADAGPRGSAIAARAAGKAQTALDRHDAAGAVRWAERAVAASPNDADHRMLLGRAYLAAGRFASADASLRDTLALMPDQPRASYDLALAQIAEGTPDAARATLAGVKGHVPDADLGLALALAGDRAGGLAVLTDLIRSGASDARARQNLALVFALDGRPDQARGMAMQDTPPDRLAAKLADWAAMAKQTPGAHQVAAMLGVAPAPSDPGRPTALALAAPTAAAPVALAIARPQVSAVEAPVRTVALPLAPPVVAASAAVPALLAPAAIVPATLVAATPPPRLVRVAAVPVAPVPVSPGPVYPAVTDPGFVVQLGAFARPEALGVAWSRAAKLSPRFAQFSAVRGTTQHLGGTLVRLSIGGFATRADATKVCSEIKARGGACFVRGALGDRPWQWAARDVPTRIAMR